MLTVDKAHCTGCGACVQKCPQKCISFVQSDLGVLIPFVESAKCVNCGLCDAVCPISEEVVPPVNQEVYAVIHHDTNVLENSTSGGFFSAIAEHVLGMDGVVYGCAFVEDFQAKHVRISTMQELSRIRGSKYVQSDTSDTFKKVEADLNAGLYVLYTGTPCQIAGLYGFLRKKYDNLITADVVCHGVSSQAFFDKYMQYMKEKHGNIKELHFRHKKFAGWSCAGLLTTTKDSKHATNKQQTYYDYNNYYYFYFLRGDSYRESCYSCKYASTIRLADFTMGDFWGIEKSGLKLNTKRGCSLVIANTAKARTLLTAIDKRLEAIKVSMELAVKRNKQLSRPSANSLERDHLIEQFRTMSGVQMNEQFRQRHGKAILRLKIKSMIPYRIKLLLRKL